MPAQDNKLPVPQHIAIIMDGNGRWAKQRGLPRKAGHKAGAETFRRIASYCNKIGVKYLTVYAFSTENWKRSEEEVSGIMFLLENYLKEALRDMEKNRIRFQVFGDISRLSAPLQRLCRETMERSAHFTEAQVNFCLNYGGRDEIVRAARAFAADVAAGRRSADSLTEADFSLYLDSANVPDPELVIRPSGELRTSNFLPWQSAYSEFVFMDVLWPDFSPADLDAAIAQFHGRNRRFGGA
jgi:undecaprenyl diphosphate synthase